MSIHTCVLCVFLCDSEGTEGRDHVVQSPPLGIGLHLLSPANPGTVDSRPKWNLLRPLNSVKNLTEIHYVLITHFNNTNEESFRLNFEFSCAIHYSGFEKFPGSNHYAYEKFGTFFMS